MVRNLHISEFLKPGLMMECLEAQWKRAILGAALMSVFVSADAFDNYDSQTALQALENEWKF